MWLLCAPVGGGPPARKATRELRSEWPISRPALAVVVIATGTLVVFQVAVPEAAQEPAATGIDVGNVYASMGQGHTRENPTGANLNDSIRYGIVRGMSENRVTTGQSPMTTWLGGEYAKNNDAWTYIARGAPWKWDGQKTNTGPVDSEASKKWMRSHYDQWSGAANKIWVNGQSAIGFKPNNPGTVQPGETFLLGAIRHNNLPIQQAAAPGGLGQPYLRHRCLRAARHPRRRRPGRRPAQLRLRGHLPSPRSRPLRWEP